MCFYWRQGIVDQTEEKIGQTDELTLLEITRLIDDLARSGVRTLCLTGGEPFMRGDIIEIIAYAKKKRLRCNILTNATMITDMQARRLVDLSVDHLAVSVEGPREIHDRVRGTGAYLKAEESVTSITRYRDEKSSTKPSITLACTISSLNISHIDRIMDIARQWRADDVGYSHLRFTSSKREEETRELLPLDASRPESYRLPKALTKIDAKLLHQKTLMIARKSEQYGIPHKFRPPLVGGEVQRYYENDRYSYVRRCFYPWTNSRITASGDVYPCLLFKIGNIRERPFSQLWNSPRYRYFRSKLKKVGLFPYCLKCCRLTNKKWDDLPFL